MAVEERSSNNIDDDKETIKYLIAKVDLLQEENRRSQVRTEEMFRDLVAVVKGGSVPPPLDHIICCPADAAALSQETTNVDSSEETNATTHKRKLETAMDSSTKSKKPSTSNAFEEMARSSQSMNSIKNFENYQQKSVLELVRELVKQDVHVMNGSDPLGVKGESKNKHTQSLIVLRFVGTMCTTKRLFTLFSGENRERVDTGNKAESERRMNDVNDLVKMICDNLTSFIEKYNINSGRKKSLTGFNIKCGALRGILETKSMNTALEAVGKSFATWDDVKALIPKK